MFSSPLQGPLATKISQQRRQAEADSLQAEPHLHQTQPGPGKQPTPAYRAPGPAAATAASRHLLPRTQEAAAWVPPNPGADDPSRKPREPSARLPSAPPTTALAESVRPSSSPPRRRSKARAGAQCGSRRASAHARPTCAGEFLQGHAQALQGHGRHLVAVKVHCRNLLAPSKHSICGGSR